MARIPGYTLYDVADRLRVKGWQVPAYPLTGSVSDISVQRILVRQDVSRDLAFLLINEIERGHPPLRPAPGVGGHDPRGVGRLQPPVGGRARGEGRAGASCARPAPCGVRRGAWPSGPRTRRR